MNRSRALTLGVRTMLRIPVRGLCQEVGEAQEDERVRLPFWSPALEQLVAFEVQQRCLFWRDAQPEGGEPFLHFLSEPRGVREVPKRGYKVVGEAGQPRVASAGLLELPLEPQVKDVVQVDIRKYGADWTALRYSLSTQSDHTVVHHAGFQPFVQVSDESAIVDPMPYEFPEPVRIDCAEEIDDVNFYDVPRPMLPHPHAEMVQRRVRTAIRAEPVGAVQKALLEHCAEYPRYRLLHHSIFDRGDA
jgi:hypothetical protein